MSIECNLAQVRAGARCGAENVRAQHPVAAPKPAWGGHFRLTLLSA
jgi:hypothetical protein